MKLLTNHSIKGKDDVLRILKSYITRWRIEELFRVQKEEFQLEKNANDDLKFSTNFIYHFELYHWALFISDWKEQLSYPNRFSSSTTIQ